MSVFQFISSRVFLKQLVLAIVLFFAVAIGLMQYLKVFTRHGEEIEVPNLTDLHMDQIELILNEKSLRYQVIDSTYLAGKQPNLIYDQDPRPGSKVKEGRTIYISITSSNTPKVKLPDLVDLSLRKATIDLKNLGLTLGELIMRPDIANNVVLEMQMNGAKVFPGREIAKGTTIDLVVGIYNIDSLVAIPNLIGLTVEEARFYLSESALYLGRVNYEGTISDSSKALVLRQFPEVDEEELINTMSYIDIWVAQQ